MTAKPGPTEARVRARSRRSTKQAPSPERTPADIERGLSLGCRFALAAARDGYVDADAGSGHTNNALRRRGLLDDSDPTWLGTHWGRPLTDLGTNVAALARTSKRPGGGQHPKGPGRSLGRAAVSGTKPDVFADQDPSPPAHLLAKPEIKNRNPLETPDDRDYSIQVTWSPGDERRTALVTVRGKDHDLTVPQLRSFGSALLEAAADIDGESAEPRVTQRQLDMMRHATGGSLGHHRNFCHAPPDDADHIEWTELVAMGLAGEGEPPDSSCAGENKGRVFHVTESGFRMTYGDVRKPKRGKR